MAAEEMRTMWVIFLGSGMVFGAAALALNRKQSDPVNQAAAEEV